jgi:anti-anti-sigma regulatory factor
LAPCIDIHAPDRDTDRFDAVVALRGEHDLLTREGVRVALASVRGRVLVDLTACTFLDATIIGVLLARARRLDRIGSGLEVLLPVTGAPVARVLELVHIRDLVTAHDAAPTREDHR